MNIEEKKVSREKVLKDLYPSAEDRVKEKTQSELHLGTYLFHYKYTRFFFAFLSFILYLPTIIELFSNSFIAIDYIRNIILIFILLAIEVGLSFYLFDYFMSFYSKNKINKSSKKIAFSLGIISILLSSLSGVNTIDITDNGQEDAITQTRAEKKEDIQGYLSMIKNNDILIANNSKIIKSNNELIKDLKNIAATKKGNRQITSYLTRNKELQNQNKKLITENSNLRQEIKDIRKSGDKLMKERISSAGKKEIIYMVIFFVAGLFAVLGLFYTYRFIGKYNRYLVDDSSEIEALQDLKEEELKRDIKRKSNKDRIEKMSELDNIDLDKKIKSARQAVNEEDFSAPQKKN
jgi:hypothetical protein